MANITLRSNKSKLFEVKGDEIRLSDGRLVGDLLPGLPAIVRAEAIDLLEGHVAYELGFNHGCREVMSCKDIAIDKFTDRVIDLLRNQGIKNPIRLRPRIKGIVETFIMRIDGGEHERA